MQYREESFLMSRLARPQINAGSQLIEPERQPCRLLRQRLCRTGYYMGWPKVFGQRDLLKVLINTIRSSSRSACRNGWRFNCFQGLWKGRLWRSLLKPPACG